MCDATSEVPNLTEWRERAEFWASRHPHDGLHNPDAVAFAKEVVTLLDRLRVVLHERDEWRDQVCGIRAQQRAALKRAEEAEAEVLSAHTYCARPAGVCLSERPLPR